MNLPLATLSSSSYYLFSLTRSHSFFSLSFSYFLFLDIIACHPILSCCIRLRLLFPDCFPQHTLLKMLTPLNPIKMLFISITMTYCLQYLKIRTLLSNLSLFCICCSITHNSIMLLSLLVYNRS